MSAQNFAWTADYDPLLQKIASDALEGDGPEWDLLRNIVKHKISENTSLFLSTTTQPQAPPTFQPQAMPSGGLKLPPFPPRQMNQLMSNHPPVNYMTEEQASQMKTFIFNQLDDFDAIPFTIQRLCELCVDPKKHYNSVGKYLRAVEKSLLVTSTWASFPNPPETANILGTQGGITMGPTASSTPATPLFSPIPFLHNDARRSQSRSPPPSPLMLATGSALTTPEPFDALDAPKAIGLVDELDDPGPGHMSEHPVALTSVTTVAEQSTGELGSLEERFVKADDGGAMAVDEENKENNKT